MINFVKQSQELTTKNIDHIIVTITGVKGSSPADLGAKLIVTTSEIFGTAGGGKIEAHCINYSRQKLSSTNTSVTVETWNLQRDIGMTCGGEVSFLFEYIQTKKPWDITIFGAGHISQKLVRILSHLECHIRVVDNRQEWLSKLPSHSNIETHLFENMKEAIDIIPDNSYVALMTMGHAYDVPILERALREKCYPYLGVIGSKSKRNAMEKELQDQGISEKLISTFKCPIGLKIGSNEPSEIAISIISELLQVRDTTHL